MGFPGTKKGTDWVAGPRVVLAFANVTGPDWQNPINPLDAG